MDESDNSGRNTWSVIIILVLFVLIVGGYFLYQARKSANTYKTVTKPPVVKQKNVQPMNMQPQTVPTLSLEQQNQIKIGSSSAATKKAFTVLGGNFYFVPSNIIVNRNDTVTIKFTNSGGVHDFVLPDFGVKSNIIKTGQTTVVSFTATQSGSFVFYCSLPHHKQLGMYGVLTVK